MSSTPCSTPSLCSPRFPESREAVDRALHEDGHWAGVLRHRRRDGGRLVISSRQALLRHPDGAPRAIIELNSDDTERHNAELHIEQLNLSLRRRAAELDAANHELESFAYSVAHDLRGPLRAVAGFTALLERRGHIRPDDEAGRALIERVTRATARMGELIEALLELAQLSRCEIHRRRVDISAAVREIGDELRAAEPHRGVELLVEDGLNLLRRQHAAAAGRRPARSASPAHLEPGGAPAVARGRPHPSGADRDADQLKRGERPAAQL
jgi:signal transduction histidine kinase